MEEIILNVQPRTVVGKQVKALRREGKLPAVIYGRHTEPININLDAHSAALALGKLTSSSLVTINVDGTEYPALVREKQRDYIKNRLLHVDFLAVSMTEKLRTYVSVHFTGVSGAVKDYNAVLVKNLEQLEVEALPNDLPERIDVDITSLAKPGDGIRVHEVEMPIDPEIGRVEALAEQVHVPGAIDDLSRQRALGRVPDEDDARLGPPEVVAEVVAHAAAGAHPGTGHDDGAAGDAVDRHGIGVFAGEAKTGQVKGIAP